jgi:hypothetical protein
MFWNRQKKLLGNDVEPNCAYCTHAEGDVCVLGSTERPCGRFLYDPLKRIPKTTPRLKTRDPDEFKL